MIVKHSAKIIRDRVQGLVWLFVPPTILTENRWDYQRQFIKHTFTQEDKVLDVGSGGDPFPYATVLVDKYLEPTVHRKSVFKSNAKPVYQYDITDMKFADKEFDYVVCSHVLEHVDNPIAACKELQRVGKAGYIESPAQMKDMLFSWAKGMHKWYLISQGNTLFFFEYTDRQAQGIRSEAFERLIFSTVYNPLQKAFNENQDVFNIMFEWKDEFNIVVIKKDGEIIR